MIQHYYYHDLINEIFRDLDRFSSFSIQYNTVARTDDSGDCFVLKSVNRMEDPEIFRMSLQHLITMARSRIMSEMKSISVRDSSAFLEEVLDRYLGFKRYIIEPGKTPAVVVKAWGIDSDLYLFCPHRVSRADTQEIPGKVPASVLNQASEFARIYFEQVDEAVARARAFLASAYVTFDAVATPFKGWDVSNKEDVQEAKPLKSAGISNGKVAPNGKIVLNCSVGRLGLHLRLLYDEGFFPNITKTELCKLMVKTFCTVNQEDISYRSLKNAMDAPKEQALLFFVEKWSHYLDQAELQLCIN
jgi:hypothetical protein